MRSGNRQSDPFLLLTSAQVHRWFDTPHYEPSASEYATVHAVLAQVTYQDAQRNNNRERIRRAHDHYRLALSKFSELIQSHTVADVQALVCTCIQMRNYPKPGAAWIMCRTALNLAIEMGLHRSARAWAERSEQNSHDIENRKRVFWSLFALDIGLSGKLGRPMALRLDDIDVEFPEPVEDCLPSDTNLSAFNRCSFHVGIAVIKLMSIQVQMYSSIYSVRPLPPHAYEQEVRRLEQDLLHWRQSIPQELADWQRAQDHLSVFAMYLDNWELEFRLLLHFPAVCRSENPQDHAAHLQECLDTCTKLLTVVDGLRKLRSLDIPWVSTIVYLAAIFTTLYVWTERKDQITPTDFNSLRMSMEKWLAVVRDISHQLGKFFVPLYISISFCTSLFLMSQLGNSVLVLFFRVR